MLSNGHGGGPVRKPGRPLGRRLAQFTRGEIWNFAMSTSDELLRSFLEYCSAECGLSINTLKAYEADVSNFLTRLKIKSDAALRRLSPAQILDYVDSCRRGGLSTNSVWR